MRRGACANFRRRHHQDDEYGNNNAAALAAVARPYLDGRMAMIAGDNTAAITFLRQAVVTEDALTYDEPPGWYLPSRNALGVALVRSGDFVAAERVFRDELVLHPESGRALFGLQTALLGQGRDKEAAALTGREPTLGAQVRTGVGRRIDVIRPRVLTASADRVR
jgi:Flp pilus assembly protein TadD